MMSKLSASLFPQAEIRFIYVILMRTTLNLELYSVKPSHIKQWGKFPSELPAPGGSSPSPQAGEGWSGASACTGAHHERAELDSRKRKTPPAHLCFPRKGRETAHSTYLGGCPSCASRGTKEQTLPSPSPFKKIQNIYFLFQAAEEC